MSEIGLTPRGLELEAPQAGDIVTVLIRPPKDMPPQAKPLGAPRPAFGGMFGGEPQAPEWENTQHYRINDLWRVVAVNGGHAVVEKLTGYKGDGYGRERELWAISRHRWFDASDLWEALRESQERADEQDRKRREEMEELVERMMAARKPRQADEG